MIESLTLQAQEESLRIYNFMNIQNLLNRHHIFKEKEYYICKFR